MPTNRDRRRELRISDLRYAADRILHSRNLLQIELSATINTHRDGWRAPAAVALKEAIRAKSSEWARLNEEVRALLQEVA